MERSSRQPRNCLADTRLVSRNRLQKPPSRGLEESGSERGGRDEGLKVEEGFTFGRLQEGFKGASRRLERGLKGA